MLNTDLNEKAERSALRGIGDKHEKCTILIPIVDVASWNDFELTVDLN